MKYKHLIFFLFLAGFFSTVKCQVIKNFQAAQEGNQVKITYDLSGKKGLYNINLFYSVDKGKTWMGPMLRISGDAGERISPGTNKLVIWDALAEHGPYEGMVQFKIEMELMTDEIAVSVADISTKKDSLTQREKTTISKPKSGGKIAKIAFIGSAVTSAAIGLYAFQQGNSLYKEYEAGSEDAANLRKKIEGFDKITPIGFAIAGICGAGFVYEIIKTGKTKKQVTLNPFPVHRGGVFI